MIRLGGKGLPPTSDDPVAIARAHVEFGYGAAYCPEVAIGDRSRIAAIRRAFAEANVMIAEVGIWRNLISRDEAERKANLAYACEKFAIADEVGATCCVSFIGSFVPHHNHEPSPDNLSQAGFDACVETVRYLIDTVKPKRTYFSLEMMQFVLPDSVEACRDLILAVDRQQFAAHLDPVNIILTPRQYFENSALIRHCFDVLGRWIVSCHAKDLVLRNQLALHIDEIRLGLGNLDYRTYLRELHRMPAEIPLLLEHLPDEDYAPARDHLLRLSRELDIHFVGTKPAVAGVV
jgi:sugar phosphate isomerase/epimerase